MQVKALRKILYKGEIYEVGAVFEMDEVSAGISEKYNNVVRIGGGEIEETENTVAGLPPLDLKRK